MSSNTQPNGNERTAEQAAADDLIQTINAAGARIERMLDARQGREQAQQRREQAEKEQAARDAKRRRHEEIAAFFGDLWPALEMYAGEETQANGHSDHWLPISAGPLHLAPVYVQPHHYSNSPSLAIKYTTALGYQGQAISNEPANMELFFAYLRQEWEKEQAQAADLAESARKHKEQQAAQAAQQAAELAAWGETYRAYLIARNEARRHNAALIEAWNDAHRQSYEIIEIAYPTGAGSEGEGEATVHTTRHPGGEWIDPAGYRLIVNYDGETQARRYPVILWETAPETHTPGPDCKEKQRIARIGRYSIKGQYMTLYAAPAAQSIDEEIEASGLRQALLDEPQPPATPRAAHWQLQDKIDAEVAAMFGEEAPAADVQPDDPPF